MICLIEFSTKMPALTGLAGLTMAQRFKRFLIIVRVASALWTVFGGEFSRLRLAAVQGGGLASRKAGFILEKGEAGSCRGAGRQ
jgi:hypothetical protein